MLGRELVLADGRTLIAADAHPDVHGHDLSELRVGLAYDGAHRPAARSTYRCSSPRAGWPSRAERCSPRSGPGQNHPARAYINIAYGPDGRANMVWTDMRDPSDIDGLFFQFIYYAQK